MRRDLLAILQLASPTLPVGAYSYSEGIESLVERKIITDGPSLDQWLRHELNYGSISLDAKILVRVFPAIVQQNVRDVIYWNHWLSAQRDTEELRLQSWQMGNALMRLITDMGFDLNWLGVDLTPCNYTIAFAITAHMWGIAVAESLHIYLFSWASNLISAGMRTIPIGQTTGQKLLCNLHDLLIERVDRTMTEASGELEACSVGLGLASMYHETQYSRLFRS